MDREIADAITAWETTGLTNGYAGLNDLAARSFSGAVRADDVWAFMLNGRVIGLVDGPMTAFEGSETTAYVAPDPALPLLYTMQSSDCEKEAAYYTNRTPIAEVDATLTSGGFTGYIELAENVHSGDYYVVYYGGKSMSVAFIGNQRQLLTDEEAFQRANDEVGIYDVYAADIEVTPIPEPESPPPDVSAGSASAASTSAASSNTSSGFSSTSSATDSADSASDERRNTGSAPATASEDPFAESQADSTASTAEPSDESPDADRPTSRAADDPGNDESSDEEPSDDEIILGIPETSSASDASEQEDTTTEMAAGDLSAEETADDTDDSSVDSAGTDTSDSDTVETVDGEASDADGDDPIGADAARDADSDDVTGWDEDDVATDEDDDVTDSDDAPAETADGDVVHTDDDGPGEIDDTADDEVADDDVADDNVADEEPVDGDSVDDTPAEGAQAASATGSAAAGGRGASDSATEQLESLRSELEAAKAEIRRLREQSTPTAGASDTADRHLSVEEALADTNLFVRYDSRGQPTLDRVDDAETTAEAVNENLRIDPHTTFDSDAVVVGEQPFDAFLAGRIEVDFVDWLVRKLPYEIRDTRNQRSLGGLYEAIPEVDRAELRGGVDLGADEAGEPQQQSYDLVVRNKMGEPLFVVVIEDSPHPVGGELIERLIRDGNDLAKQAETFQGVFAVTTSYYGPEALEAVSDATSGGLLSRNKKKGFVSVSRKRGFHVCLTDYLNGEFDLRVPEL